MSLLVVDVGTSGVRAAVVRPDCTVDHVHHQEVRTTTPAQGFVEVDASKLAAAILEVARRALSDGGPVTAVGIASQRATTIVWDRATGEPLGPGVSWQDLRTVIMCLSLAGQGVRLAPNQSATKPAFLLDLADPDRRRSSRGELCFGTVDCFAAWVLSAGSVHVTDATNAGVTGLVHGDGSGWDGAVLETLRIPPAVLPTIVDSSGLVGEARALPGSPPIAGLAGDQQASLIGQGCTGPGLAKATFGTGGMLDVCVGPGRPAFERRGPAGTFPIIAWQRDGIRTWGLEAVMLSAGSCVGWLRDLGVIATVEESDALAASCPDTGGVTFVPAFAGLGTPVWDFGARGIILGLTRGTGRAEVTRAVLEGIAARGAELLESAEADWGQTVPTLRIDGGMAGNATFVQALADAVRRPVEVAPVREATTLGAGFLAGLATGLWRDEAELAQTWAPSHVVEPRRRTDRDRWREARDRARAIVPELSALDF
jgi:glycerol kinase